MNEAKPGEWIAFRILAVRGTELLINNGSDNDLPKVKWVKQEAGIIMELDFCKTCFQMTNHDKGVCLKCNKESAGLAGYKKEGI